MNIRRTIAILLLLFWSACLTAATLPFQFTLDEDATTSAAVYQSDGTLVRTLWRKVSHTRGDHTASWDGLTDENTAAPNGSYVIKVLSHNMDYIWQGAIGNTSTAQAGITVHRGFRPLRDLTFSGNDAFYITGYVEGDYDFRHFSTTDLQKVDDRWCWYLNRATNKIISQAGNIFSPEWVATDTDGTWVYFAAPDSTNPTKRTDHTDPGFIVASDVSTHQSVSFTSGAPIENGPANFLPFANGIKVGTVKGLSGMAVEKNGTTLAVSVKPENKIYLVHKRTGAAIRSVSIASPGRLAFAPNGDLWAISGTSVCKITNPSTAPVVSSVINGLQSPLDVALDPAEATVAVLDAGVSQQVKAYTTSGTAVWTLGQVGGFSTNGPTVTKDKFLLIDREGNENGSLTFGPDGTLWVNDPGNRRLLHFATDRSYLDEIMFQSVSYSGAVDANNPTRVFCDFLEFAIDYTKPLPQGWQLVRNWGANLPKTYYDLGCGVRQVATLSNGRTYGLVGKHGLKGGELVELSPQGTRLTNIIFPEVLGNPGYVETLASNGDVRRGTIVGSSSAASSPAIIREKPLQGFDAQNNPIWGVYSTIASAPVTDKDPAPRCCSFGDTLFPVTSTDVFICFDATKNNGWHLGGIRRGGSDWLWKASPSVSSSVPLDGLGSFDIGDGVNYPGNSAFAIGKNVIFGYHGEFWNQVQACQFMHFYDDGLFIGQFGETSWGHETFEGVVPGRAGNSAFSCVTEVNGRVYLWANDESQHGPQRWLLQGTQTIRETSATGTLGQAQLLVVPPPAITFPVNLAAQPGDGRVSLTWTAVPNAKSYQVRMTNTRGGIPTVVAGGVAGTGKTINDLTNGQAYWFSVSAMTDAGESVPSNSIMVTPAALASLVETAGRYDQPGYKPDVLQITSANPATGKSALEELNPLLGNPPLRRVGSAGYRIFRWNTADASDAVNLPFGDIITPSTGWRTDRYLGYQFRIDGTTGSDKGLFVDENAGRKGTIDITPQGSGIQYLSVVMPVQFRNDTRATVRLTPRGQTSPVAQFEIQEAIGINHIFQFRFSGPVTLSVECPTGTAAVQAIFLDRAGLISAGTTGFQLWQQQNFPFATGSESLMTADPDSDGQVNIFEYAMGSSPKSFTSIGSIRSAVQRLSGIDFLTLQFVRDTAARDVFLRVGGNSTLTDPLNWVWHDVDDPAYKINSLPDVPAKGLETITVRDVVPASGGARFMRLSVTP